MNRPMVNGLVFQALVAAGIVLSYSLFLRCPENAENAAKRLSPALDLSLRRA
jgi:hypothetical protein